MKDIKITMEDDAWMEKTGGYAKDMTLRDYFAAKAMQGYLADLEWREDVSPTGTAYAAYRVADAMLKAREA